MAKKKSSPADIPVSTELEQLQAQLAEMTERERRLQADYQNVVRRTREDKLAHSKLATKQLIIDVLDPLAHLSLASEQLKDPGLRMVIDQLWTTLGTHGLQQIEVLGKPFDVNTMEAVEAVDPEEASVVVSSVVRPGFTLNGEVIQHAKVVVG